MFRVKISNQFIVENGDLYGNHLTVDAQFLRRGGLEISYLQLWEGNKNFGNNTLGVYTALAKYHRVRTEKFNAWWGLGATYVAGEVQEFGFAYGLGAELFLADPLSLELNFTQSFINKETLYTVAPKLNYHKNRYIFSGGYEHIKIGSEHFSMFSVGIGVSL